MSNYEEKIISILKKEKINFQREKKYIKLGKGKYRFDFLVFYKGKATLVEVNGEQHYYQVKKFQKTRKEFLNQQGRDRKKIRFCLTNKIPLYIIPFWEIDNLYHSSDIFQEKFLAKDIWKNDKDWNNYKKI